MFKIACWIGSNIMLSDCIADWNVLHWGIYWYSAVWIMGVTWDEEEEDVWLMFDDLPYGVGIENEYSVWLFGESIIFNHSWVIILWIFSLSVIKLFNGSCLSWAEICIPKLSYSS